MKTVLMIAPYFPPRRRVGSLRPFKFAIHLREHGWNPVVLTIAHSGGEFTTTEKDLLNDIRIIEVKPPFDKTTRNPGPKKTLNRKFSIGDKITGWIDRNTPADSWIFLFWMNYLGILSKVRKVKPDLIWSTGDPWSGHWLAEKLTRDISVPWVADFRDPWTLTRVNLRQRSPFSSKKDREIEKRVIENADSLIFTARSTEEEYARHYKFPQEKSKVIYNSFDSSILSGENKGEWNPELNPDYLHLLFFGTFRRLSPAGPIAKAIHQLKQTDPLSAKSIRVHSFGSSDEKEKQQVEELGLKENFVEHQPVLPEQSHSVLTRADVLLVSTHSERKQVIPAKLWDYLSVKRPVLSVAPNPEIKDILKKSKAGVQADPENLKKLAEILASLLNAKREGGPLLPAGADEQSGRQQYEASHTTAELVSIFDELTGNG